MQYIATIEEVERRTGLSFLSAVPDDQRDTIKRTKAAVIWQWRACRPSHATLWDRGASFPLNIEERASERRTS